MNRVTRRHRRAGFSLIEVTFATLLIGIMLLASLRTVGGVLSQRGRTETEVRALLLGQQLLTEILSRDYSDPTSTPVFGRESSEAAQRLDFDDVDDYHQWNESPPTDLNGTALTGATGWQRRVTVQFVNAAAPETIVASDSGAKRITVDVYENSTLRSSLKAVKCTGWPTK